MGFFYKFFYFIFIDKVLLFSFCRLPDSFFSRFCYCHGLVSEANKIASEMRP